MKLGKKLVSVVLGVVMCMSCMVVSSSAVEVGIENSGNNSYTVGAYHEYNRNYNGICRTVDFTRGTWGGWFYTDEFFMSASPQEFFIGDLDLDGYVSTLDLDNLEESLNHGDGFMPWYNCIRDVDQNGVVDRRDYYYLRNYLFNGGETQYMSYQVSAYAGRHMAVYKCYHYSSQNTKKTGKYNGYAMQYRMDWRTINGATYGRTQYYINGSMTTRNKWRDTLDY